MIRRLSMVVLVACLTVPLTLAADELPPSITAAVETALESDASGVDTLYRESIIEFGDIQPVIDAIDAMAADESLAALRRRSLARLGANLLRRRGDLGDVIDRYEAIIADEPAMDDRIDQARFLDAAGRTPAARAAYETLLSELDPADPRHVELTLRLALLDMDRQTQATEALAAFARDDTRPSDMRNRAAIILALLGRPGDAVEVFTVDEDDPKRVRQDLRRAEWAIAAGDAELARRLAWIARENATLTRDRRYALALLAEAHRLDDSLATLIERFRTEPDLDEPAREMWIALLRDTGRYDEAIELFQSRDDGSFTVELRRQLLEMYRAAGRQDAMVAAYRDLIADEPTVLEWRDGLARHMLERGDREGALAVWSDVADGHAGDAILLPAAEALRELGLDDQAMACAERCIEVDREPYAAMLFLHDLHRRAGRIDDALAQLTRIDGAAPADHAVRLQLAEAYERLDQMEQAVLTMEGVRDARGVDRTGEDLEMRLAWLYSEIGREDDALEAWRSLWRRIDSIPRRRYTEDRMMTVASRLGKLADIAIDLEEKLIAGTADARDAGLLVRLYTKVSDAVSAAEIIDEYMRQSGGDPVDALTEKARVYIACNDYHNYEEVVRELIEIDPEGEREYLQQLVMSQLERGRPDEARAVLERLKELDSEIASAEFEAGVLAISGLRDEAIVAYRRGLANNANRIESYLLLANLLRETGQTERAIGMFQYLAETAEEDDLFTIAIDGLLNMEAQASVVNWARRITLLRLAQRHDKMYLYQLLSDLAEEASARDDMLVALESSLPIAGERRPSILRELMDLSRANTDPFGRALTGGNSDRHLVYGRRLITLAEIIPPQVYLDLGAAFLEADDVDNAARTFGLATDLPDEGVFEKQVASLFEEKGHLDEALRGYERVLVAHAGDVGVMAKVAELQEQRGSDDAAVDMYRRAMDLLMRREPLSSSQGEEDDEVDPNDPFRWYFARNIEEFDRYYPPLLTGLLVAMPRPEAMILLDEERSVIERELALVLARVDPADDKTLRVSDFPRLQRRLTFYRRVAAAYARIDLADEVDLAVLVAFDEDDLELERAIRFRTDWGFMRSARDLLAASGRSEESMAPMRLLVGTFEDGTGTDRLPIGLVARRVLPLFLESDLEGAQLLVRRTDFASVAADEAAHFKTLLSTAMALDDENLLLEVARQYIRSAFRHDKQPYEIEPLVMQCANALDEDHRFTLCQYTVSQLLQDPDKITRYMPLVTTLQSIVKRPLVTSDEILELFENADENVFFGRGMAPLLALLPESSRVAAMRAIWPSVQNTWRTMFLVQLVSEIPGRIGPDFADFIAESFEAAIEAADDNNLKYWIRQLFDVRDNAELVLRLADICLEFTPGDVVATSLRAVTLLDLDRTDEAIEAASGVLVQGPPDDADWAVTQALTSVRTKFLPEHAGPLLAAFDAAEADQGSSLDLIGRRLDLIVAIEDLERTVAAHERALEQYPDEAGLVQRSRRWYRQTGRHVDALRLLERQIELEPDDESLREQLIGAWSRLRHPAHALAILTELEDPTPERDDPGVRGSLIVVNGVLQEAGTPSKLEKIKNAVDEGDLDAARLAFRSYWRRYPTDDQNPARVIYMAGTAPIAPAWPTDEDEAEEKPREPSRGGLSSYVEDESENPTALGVYEVLGGYAFGRAEMERSLRSRTRQGLAGAQTMNEGYVGGWVADAGAEVVIDELLAIIEAGRAGRIEHQLLLVALDQHPDLLDERTQAVLDDLSRTVDPRDVGQLRRLARTYARAGLTDQAVNLYRWCSTRTQGTVVYDPGAASSVVSPRQLITDVTEVLDDPQRLEVIESILALADPGADQFGRRENYELLVLETWEDLLGPDEALDRCRGICESVTDLDRGLRRRAARRATQLYARAGEIDRAIECFEVSLCRLDQSLLPAQFRWMRADFPHSLSYDDYRTLFPSRPDGWVDAPAWFAAAAQRLATWMEEDRIRAGNTAQALALLSVRLHAAGNDDAATAALDAIETRPDLSPAVRLWLVDAARQTGDVARADRIERAMFDEQRLHIERLADVVTRARESESDEAALEIGATALEYTRHPRLLEAMADAAEAAGDAEQAAAYREEAAEVETLTEDLAARLKARREAREGG